jgi:hypothetical protein
VAIYIITLGDDTDYHCSIPELVDSINLQAEGCVGEMSVFFFSN